MSLVHEIPGHSSPPGRTYGNEWFLVTPWDRSLSPSTNDRIAKLGATVGTCMTSIEAFDREANRVTVSNSQRGHIEPDNYVYLDHGGIDKVWAHRDIVDHENTVKSIKHRSDIVVNQKHQMLWGYKQDQWWVVKIKDVAPPIPPGRDFNGAGFAGAKTSGPSLKASNIGLGSAAGAAMAGVGSAISSKAFGGRIGMPAAKLTGITKEVKDAQRKDVETKSNQGPTRATLALNSNQRGGAYTDGKGVAQLAQFVHMMPLKPTELDKAPVSTAKDKKNYGSALAEAKRKKEDSDARQKRGLGGGGGTGGATSFLPFFGQVFNDPDKRGEYLDGEREKRDKAPEHEVEATEESGGPEGDGSVERQMAALRGDVIFDMDGRPAHLAMQYMIAAIGDDAYRGGLWLYEPNPLPPHYLPADDQTSDQPKLERPPQMPGQYGIRPWIKIPRDTGVPPQCGVQPHFDPAAPSYGTTGVLPGWHAGPSTDAGVYSPPLPLIDRAMAAFDFPSGKVTAIDGGFILPSTRTDMRFLVEVPYVLPTNLAGAELMKFRLYYKIVAGIGQTAGETWNELTREVGAGENPATAHQVKCLRFEIPTIPFSRMGGGGRLHFWFMRRSDDTATGKPMRLVGNIQSSYSPDYSDRIRHYGGAA